MRHSATILCALFVVIAGTSFISAQNTSQETAKVVQTEDENDSMFFNVLNVVDNVCYGTDKDGAWYLIYDDADAGIFYEAIRVTKETYFKVVDALENHRELYGWLYATQEYEIIEYELKTKTNH